MAPGLHEQLNRRRFSSELVTGDELVSMEIEREK
jgi:hypothetical protein